MLRYEEFDFNSRVIVAAKDDGFTVEVLLDKPLPEKLQGRAGFNLEFLPTAYFEKSYLVDGRPAVFPLYPTGNTDMEPASRKIPQFAGHTAQNP